MKENYTRFRSALVSGAATAMMVLVSTGFLLHSGIFPSTPDFRLRQEQQEQAEMTQTIEGVIYDRHLTPLTQPGAPGEPAAVLYPSVHRLVGYNSASFGLSGLRNAWSHLLLKRDKPKKEDSGGNLITAIDIRLQEKAYSLLSEDGAIVILNARTGEVLTAVSRQAGLDYDVNALSANNAAQMQEYNQHQGFHYDRAFLPDQPQGSTMKLLTTVLALRNGQPLLYHDTGNEEGLHNYGGAVYGDIDLQTAVIKSSNTYFAHQAITAGYPLFHANAQRFGYDTDLILEDVGITLSPRIDPTAAGNRTVLGQAGFGYASVTSPLHIALEYAVLDKGSIPTPMVVLSAQTQSGKEVYRGKPKTYSQPVEEPEVLDTLKPVYYNAASAYGLDSARFDLYAKTGTSEVENEGGNNVFLALCAVAKDDSAAYTMVIWKKGVPNSVASSSLAVEANTLLNLMEQEGY